MIRGTLSSEHLSALDAYERRWRDDATDAEVERPSLLASGITVLASPRRGIAQFGEHRREAFDALSGLSARFEAIAGDGQRFAAYAMVSGVHRGQFFEVAPTGRRLSCREVHLFEIRDGSPPLSGAEARPLPLSASAWHPTAPP